MEGAASEGVEKVFPLSDSEQDLSLPGSVVIPESPAAAKTGIQVALDFENFCRALFGREGRIFRCQIPIDYVL